MTEKSKDEMTPEELEKRRREIAQSWIIGQEYAKRHLNLSALQRAQKEKELEEMQEMINETIGELESGEESEEQTTEEE